MTIQCVTVDKNEMTELSTVTGKEGEYFSSTCEDCFFRGNRKVDPYYVNTGTRTFEVDKYPIRCTICGLKSKRITRMRDSFKKIEDIKNDILKHSSMNRFGWEKTRIRDTFQRPKMVTIGNKDNLERDEFMERFREFHKKESWIVGGTYVVEQGKPKTNTEGMWHTHGVYLAPYIQKSLLTEWSHSLEEKYGLGNMHYQQAKISTDGRNWHLENYLHKYFTKDGNRKQSFGSLYHCKLEKKWDKIQPNENSSYTEQRLISKKWRRSHSDRRKDQITMKNWIDTEGMYWS